MKNKIYILIIILLVAFLIANISLAQDEANEVIPGTSKDKCDELKFQVDLINDLASHNINYLVIAVGIIGLGGILIGVFFYVFNISPLRQEIKDQKEEFKNINRENEKKFLELKNEQKRRTEEVIRRFDEITRNELANVSDKINDLTNRVKVESQKLEKKFISEIDKIDKKRIEFELKADNKIKDIDKKRIEFELKADNKIKDLELRTIWDKHNIWIANKVFINVLTSLIHYLEKGVEYNRINLFGLCLSVINEVLDKVERSLYEERHYLKLVEVFQKFEGFEKEKEKILKKARAKLEGASKEKK